MATVRTALVNLDRVCKYYGDLKALAGVNITIRRGEVVCLVGPSGCGKTTVMNIVAGLIVPDGGYASVARDSVIGYVFQEPRLLPWKTVEANIAFAQASVGIPSVEAKAIRGNLIRQAGLQSFERSFPSQLSGGMKQRVSLIRALAVKPNILLLDEPFKSMDPATVEVIQGMVLELIEGGDIGVLMVTHGNAEANRLSNRLYVLSARPARVLREVRGKRSCVASSGVPGERELSGPLRENGYRETQLVKEDGFLGRGKMKLFELVDSLQLEDLTPELETDIEITGFHMSDIMSEALSRASAGNLWITLQNHEAVIALARLKLVPAVLLVGNRTPSHGMIARAKEQGIVVLRTALPGFEVAGRIYRRAMSGDKSTPNMRQ